MIGAIIGDIVGSRFEFKNHRSKDFELFGKGCFATDDSIMTLAVAKAIMEASKIKPRSLHGYDDEFYSVLSDLSVKYMQEIGRQYPNCGYGGRFYQWVFSDNPRPYKSYGNGAAMRVSPAGFIGESKQEVERLAETVTAVTHNHREGIKGAQATAVAIYLARKGARKSEIRECIVRDYYPLDFKIDDIRPTYRFNETCQETVPQAIECFLESRSFEDAIRTAISLGGDSDTIGAITGAIAEAYYGVPPEIKEKALTYLDDRLRSIYDEWIAFAPQCDERYKVLTKYIGWLSDVKIGNGSTVGFMEDFHYGEFETEWHDSGLVDCQYGETLDKMGVELSYKSITGKDVEDLNAKQVLGLITAAFRNDNFVEGIIMNYLRSGVMGKWLKRLKDIDTEKCSHQITEVELKRINMMGIHTHYVRISDEEASFSTHDEFGDEIGWSTDQKEKITSIRHALDKLHLEYWRMAYPQHFNNHFIKDGEQWILTFQYNDGSVMEINGEETYPENWDDLLSFFDFDRYRQDKTEREESNEEDPVNSENSQTSVVIVSPDFEKLKSEVEKLRTELSMLVLERDELVLVECKNIEMAYMLTIGGLEYKAYEIQCAIRRLKRKAELIQAKKNRQEKVDPAEIDTLLDVEFSEYQAKLEELVNKMNAAIERSHGKVLSDEEARELKKLYRAIVKALHPDLHPGIEEAKIRLFQNAVTSYENGDLNGLRVIHAMISGPAFSGDEPDAISELIKEKERITGLIQAVRDRIADAKSRYPYTLKPMIQSREKTEARKAELEESIRQLNEQLAAYTERIQAMLR